MDIFNQKRTLFGIITLLVVLNLVVLGTLWFQKGKRKPPRGKNEKKIEQFLREELQLSDQQLAAFERSREAHFEDAHKLVRETFRLRERITRSLFVASPDSAQVDSIAARIGELHSELERLRFYHFQDLRALCTPEQRAQFEGLMDDLLRIMRPPGGPGGPRGPRGRKGGPPHRRPPHER